MKTHYKGFIIETKRDGYGLFHRVGDNAFDTISEAKEYIDKITN